MMHEDKMKPWHYTSFMFIDGIILIYYMELSKIKKKEVCVGGGGQ